jgi:hypothetical protein
MGGIFSGGFFGSGGKDITENNDTQTSSNVLDFTEGDGNSANITSLNVGDIETGIGSEVSFSTTDYGALDAASEIADASISALMQSQNSASNAVSAASGAAIDAVKSIADNTTQDQGAATARTLVVGAVILGLGFAFVMIRKKG